MAPPSYVREIDPVAIWKAVSRRRWAFLSGLAGVLCLTVLYLHATPRTYTVTMEVAPLSGTNQDAGRGGLSALARLGGIDLSNFGGGAQQFPLFLSGLKSQDVADELSKNHALMIELFKGQWSAERQAWKQPSGPLHAIASGIKGALGIPATPWHPPSGENVEALLQQRLVTDDDPKTPIVTLRLQSATPVAAAHLLQALAATVDAKLRRGALDRANNYTAYLKKELDREMVADYRAALLDRLGAQEQVRMMASAKSVSFAAQVFSGPSISPKPTSPKAPMVLILGLLLGTVAGVALALIAERGDWRVPDLIIGKTKRARSAH